MSNHLIKTLSLALFLFACNTTQAAVVNFQFSGTVNDGNMAMVGDIVNGSFSYDTTITEIFTLDFNPGTYTAYQINRPNALNVTFGANTITSDSLSVTVINNVFNGNVIDGFNLSANSMKLNGIEMPDAYFGLSLGTYPLDPTRSSAIKGSKLPSHLNVNDFSMFYNDGSYGSDRSGASRFGLGFDINSITSDAPPVVTPLPASAVLFAPALLGFFGLQRKFKVA